MDRKSIKSKKQGFSVFAPSFLRLGYHAQRRHIILSKEGAKNPDHAAHGKSLKQAAEASAAIADEIGTRRDEEAAHAVWNYVNSRSVGAALKKGGHADLVLRLDQFIRNSGNTSAYSWWQIGLTCAALEDQALSKKDRGSNQMILERKLSENGIPKAIIASLIGVRDQDRFQRLDAHMKETVPEGFGGDLAVLKAQHEEKRFPDEELLTRLGCSHLQIEYLKHLYKHKPKGISDIDAGAALRPRVSGGAIQKRRIGIRKEVRDILLYKATKTGIWAWRPANQTSD